MRLANLLAAAAEAVILSLVPLYLLNLCTPVYQDDKMGDLKQSLLYSRQSAEDLDKGVKVGR